MQHLVLSVILALWTAAASAQGLSERDMIQVQGLLADMGYRAILGTVDGIDGPGTRRAIRAFESETGLPVTGTPSLALIDRLRARHGEGWDRGMVAGQGSPGFDCARAGTASERAICASPRLARLDRDVAAAYGRARDASDRAGQERLLRRQRDWLRLRDDCGGDAICIDHAMTGQISILDGIAGR